MSEDPFESLVFLEDSYIAKGKAEGARYILPTSWFEGLLTGLEECFSFVAYIERHKSAAHLVLQLQPTLPTQSFDFDTLKVYLEKLRASGNDSKLYDDSSLRKHVYNLCQGIQKLLEPIQFIERQLFSESELSF
ncbi:hypothetical protein Gasu2_67880 [Galdieria sulphuraria]|uniref:Uncharacterized protein n=1 Tax=Galdieria sulphuraria TaxID=130081 RepID=M2XZK6_GALSU|nr:uncharacterized protein Gasu_34750 [Galdieria sulphuraria]EME29083.1 hypothetical protein Gasu_34750 [Galdieria sulphuraria]GJD12714.1 hypothetical protein Gasu2_67880 [Galdieria sulphuraria]|eukprot:XP_005705603.1 hypothetical protein Gasu_34750 [Galdieria sulphuraria]